MSAIQHLIDTYPIWAFIKLWLGFNLAVFLLLWRYGPLIPPTSDGEG